MFKPLILSLAACVAFATTSSAATYTWDGGGPDASWGTANNWNPNGVPTFDDQADIVFYSSATRLTNFLGAARTIRSLTFNDDADTNVNIGLTLTSDTTNTGTARNLRFDTDTVGGDATISVAAGSDGFHTIGAGGQLGSIILNDNLVIDMNGSRVLQFGRIVTGAQSITKNGTGELRFANADGDTYTYSGGFIMDGGSVRTFSSSAFGAGTLSFNAGIIENTLSATGTITNNVIVGNTGNVKTLLNSSNTAIATYSGTFALNETGAGNFRAEVTGTQELRLTGIISGAGGIEKTGAGSGALRLTAANTYSGPTTVSFGTLTLGANASIANSSIISVASGATFNVASVNGGFTLASGQTLGGSGTVAGAVSLTSTGSILSPGASPGILSFDTAQTWDAFSYEWEVNDWTGTTAGTAFDQIAITGSLDLSSGTAYQLDLLSLDAGNASGQVPNFAETARSWTILTTTGGITGFNASLWTIGTSGFSSSPTATGTFSLATGNGGQDLVLSYSPVPEPAAVGLLGVAGLCAGFGLARQRRRAGFPFGQ